MAGPIPTADVVQVPLKRGRTIDAIECELARAASEWTWLDRELPELPTGRRDPLFERLHEQSSRLMATAEHLARDAGRGSPGRIDRQLRDLVRLEDRIERQLGRLMSYLGRKRAWLRLQFTGVGHYADYRLGVNRRTAQDRTRAARELCRFPILERAYESGELGLEAVLLILRVLAPGPALPSIERAWVRHAKQVSIKRLRDEVRVTQREHVYQLRNQGPVPLSDDAWARALSLFPGTTRRRFARLVGVAQGTARIESCALLWMRLPDSLATDFLSTIESRRVHLETLARTSSNGTVTDEMAEPDADEPTPLAARAARTFSVRGQPVPTWVGLMALLEDYLTTWDDPALQTPRGENRIHSRHGWRCSAPGCTGRRNLEAHHIEYRSHGGSNDPSNLITLCRFHHQRGEHGDLASCHGRAPTGIEWRLGRDDVAVRYRNERRIETAPSRALVANRCVDNLVGLAS